MLIVVIIAYFGWLRFVVLCVLLFYCLLLSLYIFKLVAPDLGRLCDCLKLKLKDLEPDSLPALSYVELAPLRWESLK